MPQLKKQKKQLKVIVLYTFIVKTLKPRMQTKQKQNNNKSSKNQ